MVTEEELFNVFRIAYYGHNKSLAPQLESFRRAYAAVIDAATLEQQAEWPSDEGVETARNAYRASFDPESMAPMEQQKMEAMRAALQSVRPPAKPDAGVIPIEVHKWLNDRDLIPDTGEDGSFEIADLIEALNEHERQLLASRHARQGEVVAEQKLDAPAMVGHTTFGEGVSWSTVIGAAQRHFEWRKEPGITPEQIAAFYIAFPHLAPKEADVRKAAQPEQRDGVTDDYSARQAIAEEWERRGVTVYAQRLLSEHWKEYMHQTDEFCLSVVRKVLASRHARQVPDGFALVPIESTTAMDAAGVGIAKTFGVKSFYKSDAERVWSIMLAAAPPAPEKD